LETRIDAKQESMQVPKKQQRKRRLPGNSENGCIRYRAERKDHVWSYDFVTDSTEDGRQFKILAVIDEYTRECLALEVGRSFTADDVVSTLRYLFAVRGRPENIRSDNGPEFVARTQDSLRLANLTHSKLRAMSSSEIEQSHGVRALSQMVSSDSKTYSPEAVSTLIEVTKDNERVNLVRMEAISGLTTFLKDIHSSVTAKEEIRNVLENLGQIDSEDLQNAIEYALMDC